MGCRLCTGMKVSGVRRRLWRSYMMQKMDRNSEEFQICMERFEEMYRLAAEGELLGNIGMAYKLEIGRASCRERVF